MNFKALKAEVSLEGDLEQLVRPKRLRARKARATAQPSPRPASGPGRYVVLTHDVEVTLKATAYLDPDGVVRLRASCPAGYVVVEAREPTADELARAGASERASDSRSAVEPPPANGDAGERVARDRATAGAEPKRSGARRGRPGE